jgi:hypothetical protein
MGVSHFDYGFSGDPVVWQNNESISKKLMVLPEVPRALPFTTHFYRGFSCSADSDGILPPRKPWPTTLL